MKPQGILCSPITSLLGLSARVKKTQWTQLFAVSVGLATGGLAQAQTDQTWLPGGPTDLWNTTDPNWDAGAVWVNNNNALFNTAPAEIITVSQPDIVFNDMTFGLTGYTIADGAGTLRLGNDLGSSITVSTGLATISESLLDNALGASALTKLGAGTLTLSGANTFSGGTTLDAGVLVAGSNAALGVGPVSVSAAVGAQLQLASGTNLTNALTINGGGVTAQAVLYVPTGSASYSGPITINAAAGAGAHFASGGTALLTIAGDNTITSSTVPVTIRTGRVVYTGAQNYTGGTTLGNAGALIQFAKPVSMPASGTVALTSTGTTLAINMGGAGEFTDGTGTTNPGTLGGLLAGIGGQGAPVTFAAGSSIGIDTTNAAGTVTYGGNFVTTPAANVGLLKLGTGTLELTGGGTYAGAGVAGFPMVVRQGTLALNGGTHTSNGEVVIGGLYAAANGGPGLDARMEVNSGALVVSGTNYLSVGRGNGIGGVTSDLVLNNAATVTTGNFSAGFSGGNAANLPKAAITLNATSTFTTSDVLNVGESAGSNITFTLNGSSVLNANGTGNNKSLGNAGNATLILNGTSTANFGGDAFLGRSAASVGRLVLNGGSLNFATQVGKWMFMGGTGTSRGEIEINSGSLNMLNGSMLKMSNGASTGANVINQNGGSVNFYSNGGATPTIGGAGELNLQHNGSAATNNTYNLNGGTLTVPIIRSEQTTGTRTFNFNGGTLRPAVASTAFMNLGAGNARANVRDGGAIIDTNGLNITLVQPLLHSDILTNNPVTGTPDAAIDGGLKKQGAGVLTIGHQSHTYTGATTITGGSLVLNTAGAVNNSNGIIINGATAKFIQNSETAVSPTVTVTTGALEGTRTVNNVVVSDGTGGIINSGAATGVLTIGSLTFNGAGTLNLSTTGAVTPLNTTTLTTGATAPGGMVTININNPDITFTNGTYNLISYSTLGGQGFGNFALAPVPGLGARQSGTLSNQPGMVAMIIGGDLPVWTGLQSGDWTTNTIGGASNWKLQTGGTPTDYITGDSVVFDDTATGTTSINISTANVSPTSVLFNNSSLNYSISSTGGFGIASGSIIKNGTGSVTLATANTYAGGTSLNAGTININHASALGSGMLTISGGVLDNTSGGAITVSGNNAQSWTGDFAFGGTNDLNMGTGAIALGASRVVTTNGTGTLTLGGEISGTGFGFTKAGTGSLVLSGNSTYTGATSFQQGKVTLTGTINSAATPNVGQVTVGVVAAADAILDISGGTINATRNARPSFGIGAVAGSNGAVRMSTGAISTTNEFHIGMGQGAYAAMTMTGGTVNSANWFVVGLNNDRAVLNQSGGALNVTGSRMTIGAGGSGSIGVANLSGGTFTANAPGGGNNGGAVVGENGIGILNVSGTASALFGTNGLRLGVLNGSTGVVNLRGGTITTNSVSNGTGNGTFNFDGGTLKASVANATFMTGVTNAYVYSGGGTIDDGGFAVTIAQPFLAPTGNGVSATGLVVAGSGFIDTPIVQVAGDGTGATAVANIDAGGNLTGITITSPGTGYTTAPTFTLLGGGANNTGAITGTATLVANTSGGLNKQGVGTLTLSGASTYSGPTNVNAGTLLLSNTTGSATGSGTLNINTDATLTGTGAAAAVKVNTGGIYAGTVTTTGLATVESGGVIAPGGNSVATVNVGALTLSTGSLLNYDLTDPSVHDLITVTGTDGLTINGGAVRLYETGTTTAFSANGIYNLINYTGVIGGTGTSALSVDPTTQVGGKSYTFSTAAGSVTLSIATAGNTANFWNVNADGNWTTGTNWTLGSAPNGPSAIASFGGGGTAITAPRTVNLDANQTVGTLNFNSAQSFTVSGANTLTLDNGTDPLAQVTNASGTHTIAVPMALAAATTQFTVLAAADSLTVSGPLSGNTQLVKNGLGTLTLTGANTYLGNNSISGGTLALAGAGTLGDATNVLFMTGGTLNLGGTSQTVGAAVLSGGTISNGTLTPSSTEVSGTGAISITANLAGDGGLTKNGAGSVSLSGNNSYTGTTTVNAGTLIVASANALGAATAPLTFAGGTLQVDGTSFTSLGSRTLTGFPVAVNVTEAAHTVTLDQNLTVTGALVKGGAGKLVVSGTNSFSNATPVSVRAGTLEISGAFTAANGTGNGDIEVAPTTGSAATLRVSTGANVTANRVILGGNTPNSVGAGAGTLIQTGGIVNSRQWFTVGSGVNGLTTGGSGVFTMTGGILNQNAASGTNMEVANFTGTTGVVTMSGSSAINILNNGSINLGANSNAGNGTFTQDGGAVTLFSDAGVTVGGTGALRLGAAGTLPGGSTYTYNLNGGTLTTPSITRNGGGGNASTGVFNFNGGTLIPTASNADFITSALRTNVKAGGAIINTNGLDIRISGNLAHDAALDVTPDGGLIKRGAGILTLGGFSTYTGPTVIEAGTLAVSGGISGSTSINVQQAATLDVTLNSLLMVTGQTLLGDGTVLGTTTMSDGSRLSPGQNIGTLTMAGDLDVSAAVAQSGVAALVFELNSLLASDQVAFTTGALTIGTGVLAFNDFGFTGGPAFGPGTYTLFNGVAPILGTLDPDASNLSGNISGLTGTLGFSDGGNDLVLTVVPEPTASLALLGGLGFLLGLRPRRSARKSA